MADHHTQSQRNMIRRQVQPFLEQCRTATQPPVVVLGSTVNALSYVRSLGRRGLVVLAANTDRGIVAHSRCCTFVELPQHAEEEMPGSMAADELFTLLQKEGITPVALGTSDAWQVYLSHRQERNDCSFITLTASSEAIDLCVDKQRQYELAVANDVDVPAFANAGDVLAGSVAWDHFPAIIKPRWAHIGRQVIGGKVRTVHSPDELALALESLNENASADDYLLQRIIGGGDNCLFAYLGCYGADGKEHSWLIKRKLRQHPAQFGDGSYDVTCTDEGVGVMARRLLTALKFRGVVGVEFKRDADADRWQLIEINPRAVSTIQLAVKAGVDFPWHSYQLAMQAAGLLNEVDDAPPTYAVGMAHINGERDVRSFLARWKRKELTFWKWLTSVWRAQSFAIWDPRDPMPFLHSTLRQIHQQRRKRAQSARKAQSPTSPTAPPVAQATR